MSDLSAAKTTKKTPRRKDRRSRMQRLADRQSDWNGWAPSLVSNAKAIYVVAGLYFVAVVILGVRFHLMGDGESETDFFGLYVPQARSFLGGTVAIDAFRGPLYPIALGLFSVPLRPLGLGLFESAIVLSALSACLVLLFSYRTICRLFNPVIAMAAVVILMINPIFFRYSYTTGNDMLFTAMATLSVYFVLRSAEFRWTSVLGAGIFASLGYLVRYNGIAVLVAACVCIVLLNIWRLNWRKRLLAIAGLIVIFAVVTMPWGLYTLVNQGTYFYNKNYLNMAFGFYAGGQETDHFLAEHPGQFNNLVDVLLFDPVKLVSKIPLNAWEQTRAAMSRVMLRPNAFLIVVGILFLLFRRPSRRQVAYYGFGFLFMAVLWMVFYSDRFVLFLIPMFASLIVHGVVGLAGLIGREEVRRMFFVVAILATLGYSGYVSFLYNKHYMPGGSIAFRKMAEGFKQKVPPHLRGKKVVARKPYFAYFAGLEPMPLPVVKDEAELLEFLHERNADYLFVSFVAARTRPEIITLFNYRIKHQGLTAIARSRIAVLYQVDRSFRKPPTP
jgi:hypothetical protein